MKSYLYPTAAVAALLALPFATAEAGGLRGSPTSMREQHAVALERDLPFIDDAAEVRKLVETGELEMIVGNEDFLVSRVSFPYAVTEVRMFIERLAKQYRAANAEQLVVTSLTRPTSLQPRNAHELSVHPAGMAVDFRVPQNGKARSWLESTLLQLENSGVLDVTRERNPPHYHVAVYPLAYAKYVERLKVMEKAEPVAQPAVAPVVAEPVAAAIPAVAASVPATKMRTDLTLLFAGLGALAFAALVMRTRARAIVSRN